jgi:hypothetical protein
LKKDELNIRKIIEAIPKAKYVSCENGKIHYKFPIGFLFQDIVPIIEEIENNLSDNQTKRLINQYYVEKTSIF